MTDFNTARACLHEELSMVDKAIKELHKRLREIPDYADHLIISVTANMGAKNIQGRMRLIIESALAESARIHTNAVINCALEKLKERHEIIETFLQQMDEMERVVVAVNTYTEASA